MGDGSQKSEDGGQKTEDRSQRLGVELLVCDGTVFSPFGGDTEGADRRQKFGVRRQNVLRITVFGLRRLRTGCEIRPASSVDA